MNDRPLTIRSFPRAILHIDGDAFFASCEQSRNPKYRGKPLITGKERGIVASMSYEAKALGVTRAMRLSEAAKLVPGLIVLPSDYETYSLLSRRFYNIVQRYTPEVEEYSIDECFADITGLRRPLRMSYVQIAEKLRRDLAIELGFTFSVGLAPNKVLAKVASKWQKPNGFTAIPGRLIHRFLEHLPTDKIWGIGAQTSAYLEKLGIKTALQFAQKDERWVKSRFTKPHYEIWQELNGKFILALALEEKRLHYSIQKFKTFSPPSTNETFIFSQLSKNIESACIKARRYKLVARDAVFMLRRQDFRDVGVRVKLPRPTAFPHEIIRLARKVLPALYKSSTPYRSTGVWLLNLGEDKDPQPDLFGANIEIEKMKKLYESVDRIKTRYGKHTLYLGSSHEANKFQQHTGERGDAPARKATLLKGETKRKRLGIPMFLGNVN